MKDHNVCNCFEWHDIEFMPRSKNVNNGLLGSNWKLKNEVAMHYKTISKWDCDSLFVWVKVLMMEVIFSCNNY